MLQAHSLSYSPSPLVGPLFQNLSLSLHPGEKVALVGRNGVGKSKLIQVLAGKLTAQTGRVTTSSGERIAYLPQDHDFGFMGPLIDYVLSDIPVPSSSDEAFAKRILNQLGLSSRLFESDYTCLSFGEKMRGATAKLLLVEPNILLLDEPTNHLDLSAREWLESYLQECRQSVLMVCHDRKIIDSVADRVLELDQGKLHEYSGGYSDMLVQKSQAHERQLSAYERSKKEERRIRNAAEQTRQVAISMTKKPTKRELVGISKPFYAAKEKALQKRSQAMLKRVEQAHREPVQKPFEPDSISLQFRATPLHSSTALSVSELSVSFGQSVVLRDISFSVSPKGRLAVIGPNGTGKTTLFRTLLGEIRPVMGHIEWAVKAQVAYLSQARTRLDHDKMILDALDVTSKEDQTLARSLLGALGIRGDEIHKKICHLSVGERTKVELTSLLLSNANVLLLDEPTNHLDIPSLEALETALAEFPGALIFTSHDRRFVETLATDLLEL